MTSDELFASPRSRTTALLLAIFLGVFGAHRFYVGKIGTGILMACTLGGLGLWWLYDIIMIGSQAFRDVDGRVLTDWEPESQHLMAAGSAATILDELDALRAEVGELHERLDFAERLLANPGSQPKPPA